MVYNLLPETEVILNKMGEQIKMARMRRNIPAELMAEQAGISRSTLHKIEAGSPSVSLGNYASVLHMLFLCFRIYFHMLPYFVREIKIL